MPRSRRSSPPIAVELRRSRRLAIAAIAGVTLVLCTLLVAPQPSPALRALCATLTLAASLPALRRIVGLAGRNAVCGFEWDGSGRWRIRDGGGRWHDDVQLVSAAIAGPLVLLGWRSAQRRRFDAVLDATVLPVAVHRSLKGRLRIEGRPRAGRRVDGNW